MLSIPPMQPLLSIIIILYYLYLSPEIFLLLVLLLPCLFSCSFSSYSPYMIQSDPFKTQSDYVICLKEKNVFFNNFPILFPQGERGPCTRSSLSLKCFSLCINNVYSYLELQIEHQFLKDVTFPMTRSELSDMLFL